MTEIQFAPSSEPVTPNIIEHPPITDHNVILDKILEHLKKNGVGTDQMNKGDNVVTLFLNHLKTIVPEASYGVDALNIVTEMKSFLFSREIPFSVIDRLSPATVVQVSRDLIAQA